ncbi:hypothetical protein AXG93_2202s1030 [Marchantia polymorpha subsp. ruderalis]|uniref:Uncharacterized protein n=1 Tax=Marchantia polymorpha subsp. ruderalis TaxID=1480154 RepID=A0A176W6D4_MARPO|nr:hypothetical protein AXG93_2202s1030 [Marchantia polymorpha subsp. ruderalis]
MLCGADFGLHVSAGSGARTSVGGEILRSAIVCPESVVVMELMGLAVLAMALYLHLHLMIPMMMGVGVPHQQRGFCRDHFRSEGPEGSAALTATRGELRMGVTAGAGVTCVGSNGSNLEGA